MTDKTDRDALIRKLALHVRPTCSELYDEAMQALAEQPAGAVGMIELEWLHDHLSRTLSSTQLDRAHAVLDSLAAQPAASVDVEGLLPKLRDLLERINRDTDGDDYLNISCDALDLIDSAGGAKGEACPFCNKPGKHNSVEACPALNEPVGFDLVPVAQPAEGDGAVAEVVDVCGTGVKVPAWVGTGPAPDIPTGTKLYVGIPPAATPTLEQVADAIRSSGHVTNSDKWEVAEAVMKLLTTNQEPQPC